jgi:methylenetetrahydrofolate reductase (NADPH)
MIVVGDGPTSGRGEGTAERGEGTAERGRRAAGRGHGPAAPSLRDLLRSGQRSFSFEFFPPKTDVGEQRLWQAMRELEGFQPTFVSVTYGAGGSTRDRTIRVTQRIGQETTLRPVAHLTCVGAGRDELRSVIAQYADVGVTNVLALRGDPPGGPGQPWRPHPDGLDHAVELVDLLHQLGAFTIGVAAFPEGHPEAPDLDFDVSVLRAKQDAGADFAVTQFFFDASDYFRLRDRAVAAGVRIPIIPGIMPVTSFSQITRFAELSGAAFPEPLARRFEQIAHDRAAVADLGVSVATAMCQQLLAGGAPGLHFYTLNRSDATRRIYAAMGLHQRERVPL